MLRLITQAQNMLANVRKVRNKLAYNLVENKTH